MMDKDNEYYRALDLRHLAESVPHDKRSRKRAAAYHDMLIALALRCQSEAFTREDLLAYLGKPDSVTPSEKGEIWEYLWTDEHCSQPYSSSTPFVVQGGRVVGVHRHALTPAP